MRKILPVMIGLLVGVGTFVPKAAFADDAVCLNQTKFAVKMPDGFEGKDTKAMIAKRCAHSGGASSACGKTYSYMVERYNYYRKQSVQVCQSVVGRMQKQTGAGTAAFDEKSKLDDAANKELTALRSQQEGDLTELKKRREANLKHAEELGAHLESSQAHDFREMVLDQRKHEIFDQKSRQERLDKLSKTNFPAGASEELQAAIEGARFAETVKEDTNQRTATIRDVTRQTTENGESKDKSSSIGLNDLAPWAGVAIAGASALMGMQQNKAAATDPTAAGLTSPTAASGVSSDGLSDSQTAALSPTPLGTGSTGSGQMATNQPSFNTSSASQTPAVKMEAGKLDGNVSPPQASYSADAKDALSQFSGNLGGSPFSGSSTSSGGSAGTSGGSAGALDGAGRDLASAGGGGAGKASDDSALPSGGGAPHFAGGSSSSPEPALGDIFKNNPFSASMDGTASAAAGEIFNGGADAPLSALSEETARIQSQATAMGNDKSSLFFRVRELHGRCLKRGCVTSESGGKI